MRRLNVKYRSGTSTSCWNHRRHVHAQRESGKHTVSRKNFYAWVVLICSHTLHGAKYSALIPLGWCGRSRREGPTRLYAGRVFLEFIVPFDEIIVWIYLDWIKKRAHNAWNVQRVTGRPAPWWSAGEKADFVFF